MSRLTRDGTAEPPSRETKFPGAHGDRGMLIFPVQLKFSCTSRIGNLTQLIHTLLYLMTIHTYIHTMFLQFYLLYTTTVPYSIELPVFLLLNNKGND